jgi:(E)-4-hydroxy-3-methylbut-2-enyl-diphosphate synthase
MTTAKTANVEATVAQIKRLEAIGCDVIRVAIPDIESADAISKIKKDISIPLVADIHFDHKLALRSIEQGADKIRINPGNIANLDSTGGEAAIKAIANACNQKNIPIRIGVNSGSLEKDILQKFGGVTAEAMTESVMRHVKLLNKYDFDNIWLSAKSSNVPITVKTYRLLHEQTNYPLHIGITEAGTEYNGIIKNSIGIGALLLDGIGNTIRVSLTAEPEKEVEAAKAILKALGLRPGIDIISCPTCGRCKIDLIKLTQEVEKRLAGFATPLSTLTIAIMGCAVNGPGEAALADYGISVGDNEGIIFKKGKIIKRVHMDKLVDELQSQILT